MLRSLVVDKKLRARVLERAEEFLLNNKAGEDIWFRELVLCILTANSSFISAYKALNCVFEYNFFSLDQYKLSKILKECGYRFYNLKSKYLMEAKSLYGSLKKIIKPLADRDQWEAREFLVNKVNGIGYKEASHFLRNVGYFDLAIIDRHVLRFITDIVGDIKLRKRRDYFLVEGLLRSIADGLNIQVGLLDLFIFFKQTKTLVK
ncbi:N-glycosylase/DNA lyase [Sulfolobaceae archaeon RB850M]|nr:N-glycosylase/DNA lyase [Sulfolobaceae archaeon]